MTAREPQPVVVALAVGDAGVADRLAALLADLPGLRLAAPGEPADAVIVSPGAAPQADTERAEAQPVEAEPVDAGLTPREIEVLALLAEGASNKLIASRLGISVHTAKFHVGQLIDKLDATGRTDAIAHALRQGIIHL